MTALTAATRFVVDPFPSSSLGPGVPLSDACVIGMREELTQVGEAEKAVTWNGRTRMLLPSWKRKWNIKLSNSGVGVHLPPIDDLHVGRVLTFHSSQFFQKLVPVGEQFVTLDRLPAHREIHARNERDEPVFARMFQSGGQEGRQAFIGEPADGRTRIFYRPKLTVVLVSIDDLSSGFTNRETSWSMELEEEYAPL